MKKIISSLFISIGILLICYTSFQYFTQKTGQSNALKSAETIVTDNIIKPGGGTEPLPIINGLSPIQTIDGEKNYTIEDIQKYLLERNDVESFIASSEANNENEYEQNIQNLQQELKSSAYNMDNILKYYEKSANNVNFQYLKKQTYGKYNNGQSIGVLYIPKLKRSLPIIYGTSEENLKYGVGFYKNTKLPGQNDQILLSGHRDTVFKSFSKLSIGDEFHVKTAKGTFIYTIFATQIVDWDDQTVIQSTYPNEILTVSTCYPFNYLGPAPERFVFYAK